MDLKELLGDDLFKQVTEKAGKVKIDIIADDKASFYIPKSRLDEEIAKTKAAKESAADLQKQIEKAGVDLEALKKGSGENEGLRKQIEELQTKNREVTDKAAADKKAMVVTQKISEMLTAAGVNPKYTADVARRIDQTKLAVSDDMNTVAGIDTQIEVVKKDYPEWFGTTKAAGTGFKAGDTAAEGELYTREQMQAITPEQHRDPKVKTKVDLSLAALGKK